MTARQRRILRREHAADVLLRFLPDEREFLRAQMERYSAALAFIEAVRQGHVPIASDATDDDLAFVDVLQIVSRGEP